MKAITRFFVGLALVGSIVGASAQSDVQKPIEISIGANFWTGDIEDAGGDSGWVAAIDYYISKNYGSNTMSFVGVRGWFDSPPPGDVSSWGVHYGWRFGMAQSAADAAANFYFKVALGYYNTHLEGLSDEWGFGGFAGVGYEFQGNAAIEVGYQMGPENTSVNNQSWYATVGFRL